MKIVVSILVWLCMTIPALAQDARLQLGLANDSVSITSSFDGENVVVFGSIENAVQDDLFKRRYDVVVALIGPDENVVVRKKERKFGIWINGPEQAFRDVPSFYSIASTHPLVDIAPVDLLKELQIGFDNLEMKARNTDSVLADDHPFRTSLVRLKRTKNLSLERPGGIEFLSTTLFRAKIPVPSNVPIGRHTARAYLFKGGELINKKNLKLTVRKIGFEQFTYDLAHNNSLLYGILAVIMAVVTGWLASVVFRKD